MKSKRAFAFFGTTLDGRNVMKGNIIRISDEMPSTWLSSEALAIENKLELSENAC